MKIRAALFIFSFALFMPLAYSKDELTVYFIPFEIESYVSITRENIKSFAWEKWEIDSESKSSKLLKIIDSGNSENIDNHHIRVLVVSDKGNYFIDSNGVVSRTGKPDIKINKIEFMRFRDSLGKEEIHLVKSRKSK
ncbi:MAG: hypothetical protein GC149_14315 [Gammaproteobacteria bacterium]|nr:hypothetical protein [Gammaproteobacteria bacterium]